MLQTLKHAFILFGISLVSGLLAGISYLCWRGSDAMQMALFPLALFGALWLASSFTGLVFLGRWLFEFIVSPTARSTILGADVETEDR